MSFKGTGSFGSPVSFKDNQLSSPRYINIFKQGRSKSNYNDKKPENFDNPVEFGFGGSQPHSNHVVGIIT